MVSLRTRLLRSGAPALLAASFVVLSAARPAEAQNFALGAGGVLVNDSASARSVSAFGTGGFHAFAEVRLDNTTTVQLRGGSFSLPPSAPGGPNVTADHADALVQYLFDWDWFRAGFIGGAGVVRMTPKSLGEGQVPVDVKENAFTLMGGVVTRFDVASRLDLRIEADFYYFNSQADRVPILLGASVAYGF